MGLFGFLKEKNTKINNVSKTELNMSKEESISKLNMRKEKITNLCMSKSELTNVMARVAVVMDYSGSMDYYYKQGLVQDLVERLLPIALKFDDNGELDMWLFDNRFRRLSSVTEDNFYNYVNREVIEKGYGMGGTNYSPVMKDILKKYVKDEPIDYPSLVIFITDGDNFDKDEAEEIIKKASKHNVFWQFIGIGNSSFDFLEELDEMEGRFIDNANFFPVQNIHKMSDNNLYEKLLFEYPSWEKQAREKGLIK
ncbi:TPA: VWA domain-containing protein [Clostridium botulinum]|nr:VWA domain-containing protein [Clostridium botulinum]